VFVFVFVVVFVVEFVFVFVFVFEFVLVKVFAADSQKGKEKVGQTWGKEQKTTAKSRKK